MASKSKSRIQASIHECIDHAKRVHFRDIADLATIVGLENKWVLFKWAETGRMPAAVIPEFELACGCNALSKCLAAAGGNMTIPASTGRFAKCTSSAEVHLHVAAAIAESVRAEIDPSASDDAVRAISNAIESLAFLRNKLSRAGAKHEG